MGRSNKPLSQEEKFFKIVLNDLMILPAYKLRNNQRRAFDDYTDLKLKQSRPTVRESDLVSSNQDTIIIDTDIDLNPNKLTIISFWLQGVFNNDKREIIITVISLFMIFLVRAENLYLELLRIFFFLLFYYFALVSFIKNYRYYLNIQSTFYHINRLYRDINLYSSDLGNITEYNIKIKSCEIIENLIEDDISGLKYEMIGINFLSIFFSFYLSFICIYILEDDLTEIIKWLAELLNFGDFEFIKKLNMQAIFALILFQTGIAASRDLFIWSLKNKDRLLNRSLRIIKSRLQ